MNRTKEEILAEVIYNIVINPFTRDIMVSSGTESIYTTYDDNIDDWQDFTLDGIPLRVNIYYDQNFRVAMYLDKFYINEVKDRVRIGDNDTHPCDNIECDDYDILNSVTTLVFSEEYMEDVREKMQIAIDSKEYKENGFIYTPVPPTHTFTYEPAHERYAPRLKGRSRAVVSLEIIRDLAVHANTPVRSRELVRTIDKAIAQEQERGLHSSYHNINQHINKVNE